MSTCMAISYDPLKKKNLHLQQKMGRLRDYTEAMEIYILNNIYKCYRKKCPGTTEKSNKKLQLSTGWR